MRPRLPRPSLWWLLAEGRALAEMTTSSALMPLLRRAPAGDGHPVLVLPGFLATSRSTSRLRAFLAERGYAAHRWKLGRNLGFSPALEAGMRDRLKQLADRYGRSVSLVGWSLGGVYARELGRDLPSHVRQVISLGSPFAGGGTGTNVRWLFDLVSQQTVEDVGSSMLAQMAEPPPVPTTAVFSRTDGVAHWHSSREQIAHEQVENIAVAGSHVGLGFNARVLWLLGDRLAQPDGAWRPFEPTGALKIIYPWVENHLTLNTERRLGETLGRLTAQLDRIEGRFS